MIEALCSYISIWKLNQAIDIFCTSILLGTSMTGGDNDFDSLVKRIWEHIGYSVGGL